MKRRSLSRTAAAVITAALLVTACTSGDDDSADEVQTTEGADAGDTSPEPTQAPADESTTATTDTATTDTAVEDTPDTTDMAGDTGETSGDIGEVGGSGCGTPHGAYDPADPAGEVRVAWNDPLLSFNNNTSHANASANFNIQYLTQSGFNYYDGDLELINNDSFGTCTIESLDPLTITYRINDGVTWSDGTPIDAADMMLFWASQSTVLNDGGVAFLPDGSAIQADENGFWLVEGPDGSVAPGEPGVSLDPATFQPVEGYSFIPAEGVNFDAASEQFALVTQTPEISDDGQAVTMTYDSFYVDYQINTPFLGAAPAHVVGRLALGVDDPAAAKQALIDAIVDNDREALASIADTFNTAFDDNALPEDEGVYLSSGMYQVTAYDELSEIILEANPAYDWGPMPKVQTIVYRIIGDPTASVQALANEEIDVMQPQATVDSVAQLEGYADRGIELVFSDDAVYEHVDFVATNAGPFDPATYDGDEATALAVRQAFMKTLPRQEIVDRLIAPINPDARVRDSFTQVPGSPWYDDIVADNGTADYADVDIDGAAALLADAGVETPIDVRVLFADNNPRRASEFDLMAASAAQAGFNLVDGRSPTWSMDLVNTSIYDVALFGWRSTAVAVADTAPNFISGGQNNYYGFSDPEVDALYDELQGTTDPARQKEILIEVESILTETGFGLPLYQHPGVTAFNSNYVSNIDPITIAPTIFWNVWDWEAA